MTFNVPSNPNHSVRKCLEHTTSHVFFPLDMLVVEAFYKANKALAGPN